MRLDLFRLIVASAIVLAWLVSVVVSVVSPGVAVPASVHIVMLIVAGWLFEPAITKRWGGRE